jgi:hypothetical protein
MVANLMSQQQKFMKHLELQVEQMREQRDMARRVVYSLREEELEEKARRLEQVRRY